MKSSKTNKKIEEIMNLKGQTFHDESTLGKALDVDPNFFTDIREQMKLYDYRIDEEKYRQNMEEVHSYIFKEKVGYKNEADWEKHKKEEENWAFCESISDAKFKVIHQISGRSFRVYITLLMPSGRVDYSNEKYSHIDSYYVIDCSEDYPWD